MQQISQAALDRKLSGLRALVDQGVLTEDEFALARDAIAASHEVTPTAEDPVVALCRSLWEKAKPPIETLLKSPRTAIFPEFSPDFISLETCSPDEVMLVAYVDSENGFGALIRTPVRAKFSLRDQSLCGISFRITAPGLWLRPVEKWTRFRLPE